MMIVWYILGKVTGPFIIHMSVSQEQKLEIQIIDRLMRSSFSSLFSDFSLLEHRSKLNAHSFLSL